MSFDIITIGSATVDNFADTDSELIKITSRTSTEQLIAFPLGSKLLIQELNTTVGGGGTNTAAAFSRLGLKTAFLGKIGSDAAGDFVIENLRSEAVEFIGKRDGLTGFSVILNSIEKDRSILAYKGANNNLLTGDLPVTIDSPWLYISSMLGESFKTICNLVSSGQFKVAFNPSNYQAELGYEALKPLLDNVTLLAMNREEACKLLGLDYSRSPEIHLLFEELLCLPAQYFVITDGQNGAYVSDRETCYHAPPQKNLNVIETTGAGDAFASTFTAGIIQKKPITAALAMAMCNCESVLQSKGAKSNLLNQQAMDRALADTERTIRKISLLKAAV